MPLATSMLVNSSKTIGNISIEKEFALPKPVILGMHTKLKELKGHKFNSKRLEHALLTYSATRGWFDYVCDISSDENSNCVCMFYNWTGYVKFVIDLD